MNLRDIDTFVLDLDGTVWYWTYLIPGVKATIAKLKKMGKRVVYVTNNTMLSRKGLAKRLTNFGIKTNYEDVIGAGIVIGHYIKEQSATAMCLCKGTENDLKEVGIPMRRRPPIDYVVVTEEWNFCFPQLRLCFDAVRSGGRLLTSVLGRYWTFGKKLVPGTGSWVKAVEFTTDTTAMALGKPSDYMAKIVSEKLTDNKRTALIGDDYESDIAFGQKLGLKTIFVRTGIGKDRATTLKPDLSLDSVKDLMALL
jgi:HAD superfamily hydrolase (TIGR01450 family)